MSLTVLIPNQNIRSEGLPYEQCKKKLDDSCVPPNLPFNITNKTNKQTNKHYYIQNHKMTIRLQSMYDDYKHLQLQRNCKFL